MAGLPDTCGYICYRHDDGKIYVVHRAYGSYTDAFTKSELFKDYFEDHENEMPEFEDPVIDEEAIFKLNEKKDLVLCS